MLVFAFFSGRLPLFVVVAVVVNFPRRNNICMNKNGARFIRSELSDSSIDHIEYDHVVSVCVMCDSRSRAYEAACGCHHMVSRTH